MRMRLLCALLALAGTARTAVAEEVSFRRDVAPLLVNRCLACHGERKFQGEYQLHTFASLLEPGESGEPPIVPGKPDDSYLLSLLVEEEPSLRMPRDADSLTKEQLDRIRLWIAAGAKLDGGDPAASLVSLAEWKHPAPPEAYSRPLPVTAVAFHPEGKELAIGGLHEITVWSVEDGTLLRRFPDIAERTYDLAYDKAGARLAIAAGTPGRLGEAKVLDANDGKLLAHFGSMADCAFAVAFSPDESRLAVGGADHLVWIHDVATGKQERVFKDHSDWVLDVAWNPAGTRLATASRDKTCKIFDVETGETAATFPDHAEPVYAVAWDGDERALSCGGDARIRHWIAGDPGWEDPEKMTKKKRHQLAEIRGFGGPVHRLVACDGELFACSTDRTARQFGIEKRNQIRAFEGHSEWLFAIDYHPESKLLAVAGFDGNVTLWKTDAADAGEMKLRTFLAAPGLAAPPTATSTSAEP
ncbi:MAG: c-type cytochrome domain-containing protein [Planctomycetaceae bacterium]